jgi:thiol-disulfide isomerase/thioredoxin
MMLQNVKICGLGVLLLLSSATKAQFKLKGKINHYTDKELKINIPLVFGFNKQNNTFIPVAKDGSFEINLPIRQAKFSNLIFQRKFYSLLLDQNKNLTLEINEDDSTLKLISGSALAENKVMQAIDLEEYPFFLANEGNNEFSKLPLEQLKSKVVQPYFARRDEKINKVMKSSIPSKAKSLISLELKSIAYNYLNDLARTQITNRATVDSLVLYVFDKSDPKPSILPAGPQFYGFIDNYVRYLENKSLKLMRERKIPSNEPLPYIGISLDSAKASEGKVSKPEWRANIAARNLPVAVVEQYSYQQIVNAYHYKELKQIEDLAGIFKVRFPKSNHLQEINQKASSLRATLIANENNVAIEIIPRHEQIKSIYDIIKPYKGKVIYLDIWGTWCGPCKEEFTHNSPLKERFKDKNVVFLYLDMDEDNQDKEWRNFIKVNQLTGSHFRRSRATIAPIWKELLANASDKAEYYPQYFIFDKDGKLAVTKANRPSSTEELYAQLTSYLQ